MRTCVVTGLTAMLLNFGPLIAQDIMKNKQELTPRQKGIVAVSAFTAQGDLQSLHRALNEALHAGLTINDTKEILVQLYAYCGFPRSLNAINTFMAVLKERKAKGITDAEGIQPLAYDDSANKYEIGKKNLEKLTLRPETGPKTGYAEFVPIIDTFLKEHLFADIFSRGVLSNPDRELTTIAALASLGNVESQLQGHMGIALNTGATETQIRQMLSIIETDIGKQQADLGRSVLSKVMAARRQGK